jgi:hypothetical protein
MKRPFGATVLAILSGILAFLSIIACLRFLGLGIGPGLNVSGALWYAFLWGLMAWVYIWLTQMLWKVQPQAWIFLAVITVFNLVMDLMMVLGKYDWYDVQTSFIINGLILIYVMLPGTKRAFGMDKPQTM